MESFLIFLILLIVIALIGIPLWNRYKSCLTCPSTGVVTTPVVGTCFPGTTFPVKSGVFDLRTCTDDIYIFTTNKAKVHFVEEV